MRAGRERDSIVDYGTLMGLFRAGSVLALRRLREKWVDEALARGDMVRESKWTESVAVGSRDFVETIRRKLGLRAKGRKITGMKDEFTLCEPQDFFGDDIPTAEKDTASSRYARTFNDIYSVWLGAAVSVSDGRT